MTNLNNNNNNGYIPTPNKSTYTISYFNEAEWNKGLTNEELAHQELINASYQDEISAEERGYGPCRDKAKRYLYGCHCNQFELQRQLEAAESEITQLKGQAQNDINELWNKFKEYDQEWENYRSAVEFYISDMKSMGKWKDGVSAVLVFTSVRFANEIYWKTMDELIGSNHRVKIQEIYNSCIAKKYNQINNWYSQVSNKYN